jgi:deoxyribodipyrimidine photo-lyase
VKNLVWLRRDLRLEDNPSLYEAFQEASSLSFVFVFDQHILEKLDDKHDPRVDFLWRRLQFLKEKLEGKLLITFGKPEVVIPGLVKKHKLVNVFTARDYEPYAKKRDDQVNASLQKMGAKLIHCKDHVVFEAEEVKNLQGGHYKVFTPYKNAWFEKLHHEEHVYRDFTIPFKKLKTKLTELNESSVQSLAEIGFDEIGEKKLIYHHDPKNSLKRLDGLIKQYHQQRDFPALEGTSKISVHLRFGTVSVRSLIRKYFEQRDSEGIKVWLSEIAWRDFYFALLDINPHIETKAYQAKYDSIQWSQNQEHFQAWCEGRTGVPIVDAAMRELNQTAWMHNRARMIVASYLTKILMIDWRWGERYFAKKLIDFDLSANNGGWQWSASTGCDAAPYFRVFNPYRQSERFDKKGEYILKYCPELKNLPNKFLHDPRKLTDMDALAYDIDFSSTYTRALVNYDSQRKKVIELFKSV